eukprot:g6699.t1
MAAMSSPEVPSPEAPTLVSFSGADVPIQAATVFCNNKAEITRIVKFSSPSGLGRHEVELTDLPGHVLVDETSFRVKGSGHCTILHVSYTDVPKETIELTQEEKDDAKAKQEKVKQDIQRLTDELTVLNQQTFRNNRMREYADRFADRAVIATAGESTNAAAAMGISDNANGSAPTVNDVDKALDWWATRAALTDDESHRLELENRRLQHAIAELRKASRASLATRVREKANNAAKKPPGRVQVTVDVLELGPIELEVKYMTRGATWSPSYDLRVDTMTDSVSCTYYGMVTQTTTEDWKGVALRLSTAEPTVHGTPPELGSKTVSLKTARIPPPKPSKANEGMHKFGNQLKSKGSRRATANDYSGFEVCDEGFDDITCGGMPAVAQVEGGNGGMGAVSFVVDKPADINSNGQTRKLTVGVLRLAAEVTHYIVPSKESAAYLQAKATNNTDYLLLASDDVSIFFDNSFVTKTSLTSVSPGESFQTFLGIDPAVKITVAPPRKTSKERGIFSKSNHVTHTHSTSVSNKKKVPVTCVIVDAMPRSTDDIIKVVLKQPVPASVSESEAITDDVLVSTALEMFGEASSDGQAQPQAPTPTLSATHVAGVIKSPSNHLAWVGKIAPQGEISVPLEYTVEWPSGKEIEICE